jgi:hypothetical protein
VRGGLLTYDSDVLAAALVFAVLTAGLVGAFGTLIALRATTVKQAQQVLSTGLMLLLLAPAVIAEAWPALWNRLIDVFSSRNGTDSARLYTIGLGMVVAQLVLFAIARQRFVRERLVEEK